MLLRRQPGKWKDKKKKGTKNKVKKSVRKKQLSVKKKTCIITKTQQKIKAKTGSENEEKSLLKENIVTPLRLKIKK